MKTTPIRIDNKLVDAIRRLAKKEGRTVKGQLELIIKQYLKGEF